MINLISLMLLLLSAIYRRPYIKLRELFSLEKNLPLSEKLLTQNDKSHLRGYKHICAYSEGITDFLQDKKQILTAELPETCQ